MTTDSTTPPVGLAVSLSEAKLTLRIDEDDTALDPLIKRHIKDITRDAEQTLQRSLITQGWRLSLDEFPDAIRLDYPPIIGTPSIKFFDAANVEQTLDPSDYMIDRSKPGYVMPAPGKAWPETFNRAHAVSVEYSAGYGDSSENVPDEVQLYILARLAEQFDSTGREFKETPQSRFVERLLDRCKVYG